MIDFIFIFAILAMFFLLSEAKSKKVSMKIRAEQNTKIREMLIQKIEANESK